MFNFFKRSKKDPEAGSSRDAKEKRSKDFVEENRTSPVRGRKDMCKNKTTVQKVESAPQGGCETSPSIATESGLRENIEKSAPVSGDEVTASAVKNDPNPTNSDANSPIVDTVEAHASKMFRKPEPEVKSTRNVKPCGHGTLAIQPRIPILINRRENSVTPPESPKSDVKHFYRRLNSNESSNDTEKTASRRTENKPNEDTVSASMKIRFDLPSISSPAATLLTNSITENSAVASRNTKDNEKYVTYLTTTKSLPVNLNLRRLTLHLMRIAHSVYF